MNKKQTATKAKQPKAKAQVKIQDIKPRKEAKGGAGFTNRNTDFTEKFGSK